MSSNVLQPHTTSRKYPYLFFHMGLFRFLTLIQSFQREKEREYTTSKTLFTFHSLYLYPFTLLSLTIDSYILKLKLSFRFASELHCRIIDFFFSGYERLKKMMKRASADCRQSYAVDEEARARLKHQTLLQEFLQLQKEFVSQKRKLQIAKQKRDTLLAEVRFLSRQTRYQLKYQSPKFEPVKDPVHQPNSVLTRKTHEREGNCNAYEDALENPCPVWVSNTNRRDKEEGEGEDQVCRQALRVGKKPQSYLLNNKRVGKRKCHGQIQ